MVKINKEFKILEETSTLLVASYSNYTIEVYPTPVGALIESDGWGFSISDTGDTRVIEDEETNYTHEYMAFIAALSEILRYEELPY